MTREPLVMHSDDLDHICEVIETLSEGYHILGPDEEKQQQYESLLERLTEARP